MKGFGLKPSLIDSLRGYSREMFMKDLMAGIIVGIVALPLAIAFGIASGVTPEKGIITAIIAGFLISLLGGSKVQIGGPTGAFIVIIYGIVNNPEYGLQGLLIATILAGFMAAGLRKLMFDNKKPTWGYGICIAVVCEVIHMILIFITNMDNSSYAFEFVKGATIPMIIGNAAAVGFSLVIVSILSNERQNRKKKNERIAQTFQRWLLTCVLIAFIATSSFTLIVQNGISKIEILDYTGKNYYEVKRIRKNKEDFILEIIKTIRGLGYKVEA